MLIEVKKKRKKKNCHTQKSHFVRYATLDEKISRALCLC